MWSRRIAVALGLAGSMLLTAACAPSPHHPSPRSASTGPSHATGSQSVSNCPVTSPDPGIPLPSAIPAEGAEHWYGSGLLWVDLGNFALPASDEDGVLSVKHQWWTADDAGAPDSQGALKVTAQLVRGSATVEGTVGGYATAEVDGQVFSWWPTVLEFPSAGCWEISGRWKGDTLVAVVLLN
jgi:hypothetical protein